jgi:ATP-dependent Lon protease
MPDQKPSLDLSPEKIPEILPILPLFEIVIFPKMVVPLVVMESDSVQLIDDAMSGDRIIGLLVSKQKKFEKRHSPEHLYTVGVSGMILKMAKGAKDNQVHIMLQGLNRFRIKEFIGGSPYLKAKTEILTDIEPSSDDKETAALKSNLIHLYEQTVKISPAIPQDIAVMAKSIEEPGILADMITSTINASQEDKQKILGMLDVKTRLKEVSRMVSQQLEILKLGSKIQSQVKKDMDKKQREYYLRQQLEAIKRELGETEDENIELKEYREKIEKKQLPEEAAREAERELQRLNRMHPSSAEYSVALTYLDWITSLPWHDRTKDMLNLKKARKILDQDHFGLEKAKKRILEYLAVRKLKPDSKGPILCLAGPPGTGKTSLGRSIARSLGRKFIRIALGGIRDEAEIRGHRRTYVGALPGRIIQGIRRAEANNPVFVLDEIDKVGSDFRGDPSSALLEVLDPEQNHTFVDHYLDVPFDLSNVMFITTANVLDTIPPPLRDRMEVLQLPGYTEEEKIKIAMRYLLPRQREAHGLKANQISFSQGAIKRIISNYTREAGLRNLEREIAAVCRGVASKIAMEEAEKVSIKLDNVVEYLGPVRLMPEVSASALTPGVVMGLAWTPAGGDLLYIEATAMKGKKHLTLTGQLGEVMKESVTTALSFIRSNADTLQIAEDFFENHDIHVHVPAGAIPKDGPSAGVTMLTALVSLITHRSVKRDLAMTGEITLRGQILPVGGIKEKVLAAHRAGIKTVILPKANQKDMEDIPKNVREKINIVFLDKMLDVLKTALS